MATLGGSLKLPLGCRNGFIHRDSQQSWWGKCSRRSLIQIISFGPLFSAVFSFFPSRMVDTGQFTSVLRHVVSSPHPGLFQSIFVVIFPVTTTQMCAVTLETGDILYVEPTMCCTTVNTTQKIQNKHCCCDGDIGLFVFVCL